MTHTPPPHSTETEQTVLASALTDNRSSDTIVELLDSDSFYESRHKEIFGAIKSMHSVGKPIDLVTVSWYLRKLELLDRVGGEAYLSELMEDTATASHVGHHCNELIELKKVRDLILLGQEIEQQGFAPDVDSGSLADMVDKRLCQIISDKHGEGFSTVAEILPSAHKDIQTRAEMTREGKSFGLQTGFMALDKQTGGLQRGDLIVLAARPSMGKTALAVQIAAHISRSTGLAAAVFELEMSRVQLVQRLLSSEAKVSSVLMRTGLMSHQDEVDIAAASKKIESLKVYIDDAPGLTIGKLRAKCRKLARQGNLGLIVIDYIQLMSSDSRSNSRQDEVEEISRGLKLLAKELDVPVIALSQLNRELEKRPNKRPIMSDLRSSGAIEQDADVILFVYREHVYQQTHDNTRLAEIIIGKQRNGPVGVIDLEFISQYAKFQDYDNNRQAVSDGRDEW